MSLVVQLQVLLIERETGFGIIIEIEVDFLSHLTVDRCLYFLVKIEDIVVSCALSQRGIGYILVLETE